MDGLFSTNIKMDTWSLRVISDRTFDSWGEGSILVIECGSLDFYIIINFFSNRPKYLVKNQFGLVAIQILMKNLINKSQLYQSPNKNVVKCTM